MISSINALDLSEFPEMFLKDNSADVVVIIGKAADAEDVIGALGIVVALQHELSNEKLEIAKLDNEVKVLSDHNSIIVGGPCANAAAAKLLGYPKNCMEGFEVGKGKIKLYEFDNGNIAMIVAGALARDTRRTTQIVANYKEYNLTGTEMEVVSVSIKDTRIKIK